MRVSIAVGAIVMACVMVVPSGAHADRTYVVRSGDTLVRIARRFRTNVPALRRANRLRSDRLRSGERITIPTGGTAASARRAGQHLVRQGDSLSAIARRYRVSIEALRSQNHLRNDNIRLGQRLTIPGRRRENRMPTVEEAAPRPSQEGAEERAERLGIGDVRDAHRMLNDEPEATWIAEAQTAPLEIPADARALDSNPPLPHTERGTLRHPLAGEERHFMRGWGSGAGGYHLALDLYADPGSPIRAAERGIVIYAGTGLRGYGRMLVILHPSGVGTAYAHNRQILVRPGELVAQGQVVSRLGNTGLSRGPHLHFMLLYHGEHCDPAPLLRPAPRRRGGEALAAAGDSPVTWTGEERPDAVRCLPRSARPHPGTRRRNRQRARRRRNQNR
jgi:murein DD-endopeptidase MepM/ murein hydrolase activator NlpD